MKDSRGNKESKSRGRVQLVCRWRHSRNPLFGPFELADDDDSETETDEDGDGPQEEGSASGADPDESGKGKEKEAAAAAAEEKEGEADKLAKDQEGYKIISGDYQVHVHIIECRDLRPKDLNGMSDVRNSWLIDWKTNSIDGTHG